MKTNQKLVILIIGGIILSGCSTQFPRIANASAIPMDININQFLLGGGLSPNGELFIQSNLNQIDLSTGTITPLFPEYSDQLIGDPYFNLSEDNGYVGWSTGGNIFAISNFSESNNGREAIPHVFIINSQTQTIIRLPEESAFFMGWSPFDNETYITMNRYFDDSSVYRLGEDERLSVGDQVDFRIGESVGGSGIILWGESQNYPIAFIEQERVTAGDGILWEHVEIASGVYNWLNNQPTYTQVIFDSPVANAIFDPSGEFILIAEWMCGTMEDEQRCNWEENSQDDVIDTELRLIQWQTGEEVSLFRLSELGDDYYQVSVGLFGSTMYWSSDGSTILINRYGASPVVLSVRYP